jgi:hypothetical protein
MGEITGAIIEDCWQYGIEIIGASPTIQASTIRGVGDPASTFFIEVAGIRVRETQSGQVANPVILGCVIEAITGYRGSTGDFGDSGDSGESGADGGLIFPNGGEGENGSTGFSGGTGGVGRSAFGVYISNGAQATIGYNTIRNILGGKGGTGGQGGTGGSGGRGGHGFDGLANGGDGGPGGRGGVGGPGGWGGIGGIAEAIRADTSTEQIYAFQNLIHNIEAGPGGDGGQKGSGGSGGNGGSGGDCSAPFCSAGNGGNGLAGGAAGTTGANGGNAGIAGLATATNGSVTFVSNTVADLRLGVGGNPGPGGFGGSGGLRGLGGTATGSGTNGSNGSGGPSGAGSGPGTVSGSIGSTRGVIAQGNGAQVQLFNNIVALGGVGTMLSSGSGSVVTADYNNFFGFQTLATGSTAMGPNNVVGDPGLAAPEIGDLRLLNPLSPAIDAGSNALLPIDIFDLDNDADTAETIPFDFAGNTRIADDDNDTVATVNIGAFEAIATTVAYRNAADHWLSATSSEAYAFDEFFPGIPGGTGCLPSDPMGPIALALDGGTVVVSAFQGGIPICAIVDASTTPAASDANLSNANGDGMVVLEFDPPVTAFYTYSGSLALGHTATMTLYADDGPELAVLDSLTSLPSTNAVLATGFGFRSSVPVHRVEITVTELGGASVGAFVGLLGAEPSLGTIDIPGYAGPAGSTVQLDFACEFAVVETPPCGPDTNGDGVVNFTDLNAVLGAFGQSGETLPADTNGDGVVNFADLNAVLAAFGTDCPT